jgi:hypothetical protein
VSTHSGEKNVINVMVKLPMFLIKELAVKWSYNGGFLTVALALDRREWLD